MVNWKTANGAIFWKEMKFNMNQISSFKSIENMPAVAGKDRGKSQPLVVTVEEAENEDGEGNTDSWKTINEEVK